MQVCKISPFNYSKMNNPANFSNIKHISFCALTQDSDTFFKTDVDNFEELAESALKAKIYKGEGANSIVYDIPSDSRYVLKVFKNKDSNCINMQELNTELNLGQPVWIDKLNPQIQILKRIDGWEHSIPEWSKTIWNPELSSPMPVTKENALIYSDKVEAISHFPEKSFENIAQKVKFLDEKGYKLDSINPNNMLVDESKKIISIVDYFKVKPNDKYKDFYKNSYMDIVALISDFALLPEHYDQLSNEKQTRLLDNLISMNILAKRGAEKAGLSTDINRFINYINCTSQFPICQPANMGKYVRKYDKRLVDFLEMLKNPKIWQLHRTLV